MKLNKTIKRSAMFVVAILFGMATTTAQQFFKNGKIRYYVNGNNTVEVYQYDDRKAQALEIPATVKKGKTTYHVTSIGNDVFQGCTNLTSVVLPAGLEHIGRRTFGYCSSLTSVVFPDALESVGDYAFEDCRKLVVSSFPDGLTSVGKDAFKGCIIDDAVKRQLNYIIDRTAFAKTASSEGLEYRITDTNSVAVTGRKYRDRLPDKVIIPETTIVDGREYRVTAIADSAFRNKAITAVMFPQTMERIGRATFQGSDAKQIYFNDGLKYIDDGAFAFNSRNDIPVNIPPSVVSIGSNAFRYCTIAALPAALQDIGKDAFYRCKFAEGLVLPAALLQQWEADDTEKERTAWTSVQENNQFGDYYSFIISDGHTPEILAAAKEKLWTAVRKIDKRDVYDTYIGNRQATLPEYLTQAQERMAWYEANKAVVEMDSPKSVSKSYDGRWMLKTVFRETGGKAGVTLYPISHTVWSDGKQYTLSGGKGGEVKLGKKGRDVYSDWVRGFEKGGSYYIKWSGRDDYGNAIVIEQTVNLEK